MIYGIIAIVFLLLALSKIFFRKRHGKLSRRLHICFGVTAIVIISVHLITTLPLFSQRPIYVWITGFALLITLILIILSGAIKWNNWRHWHRVLAFLTIIILIGHVAANVVALQDYQSKVQSITVEDIDISKIPDGKYIGECNITFIYAKVRVTVKSGNIVEIEILEHRNERGSAAEQITYEIINENKINVDAITSATNSSKVIKMAVYNALNPIA
jgi:uncharacterized protein with FMN-binding domain